MKNMTSDTKQSANYSGDIGSTRRMLRREHSSRSDNNLPDISLARNMAEQLQILEQYVAKAPVVDQQIRNNIRSAIATGNYLIDPVSIAEKFMKFEKDIFG